MSDERARLFVALELPDGPREQIIDWRASVVRDDSTLRPIASDALHVTLCFLGWRAIGEIDEIAQACGVVAGEPILELSLGEALWHPPGRPRVLSLALDDPLGTLAGVQSALSRALQTGGWYLPEARPFLAHVTVARVAKGARVHAEQLPAPPPVRLKAATLTLYRSRLSPGGAPYEALRTVRLGSSHGPSDPVSVVRGFPRV